MKLILILAALLILCVSTLAAERPDFSGKWRTTGGDVLIIEQTGDDLVLRSAEGSDRATKVTCNTMGKQCEGTLKGDSAKVSYWYNGPALIEMAIEGKNVKETRRRLSTDGKQMAVEVITIAPAGKDPEKLVFSRQEQVAAAPAFGDK